MNEELKVIIKAEIAQFKKGIDDAKKAMGSFKDQVKSHAKDATDNILDLTISDLTPNSYQLVFVYEYNLNDIKVYLDVELNQKMIIPYQERLVKNNFRLILGTKLINGIVPDIYGGLLQNNSSIIKSQ